MNTQLPNTLLSRRSVLALPWAALLGTGGELARAQTLGQALPGRLVVVFLRGAYDGLSALVPYRDPEYYSLRSQIAIPAPDGTAQTGLRLDDTFALHPALAPLMPLWQQGVLGVIAAAGSPDPTRSHFDAQHHWEIGLPGKNSEAPGWMNTLAGLRASEGTQASSACARDGGGIAGGNCGGDSGSGAEAKSAAVPLALGVGEANPQILGGSAPVKLVARGPAATRTGVLAQDQTRSALMDLYANSPALGAAFRQGANSRVETARMLEARAMETRQMDSTAAMAPSPLASQMQVANNGAGSLAALLQDAQHLGTLMRADRRLRLGFLSAGGWDTHANQGGVTGQLANNFAGLARALLQLRADFSRPNDVVMVVSEFGRTCAENGTRGTDHGHGNALWLMGNRVNGARWHGAWAGLANGNLHDGRDLPVLHDFRAVFSLVLRATQGASDAQLAAVFPGNPFAGAQSNSAALAPLASLLRV